MFSMFSEQRRVPQEGKESFSAAPVDESGTPEVVNDFRPVASTPRIWKVFERQTVGTGGRGSGSLAVCMQSEAG